MTTMSTSVPNEPLAEDAWPLLPVETEIYILPDGRVVVADLPAELAPLLAALGITEPADALPSAVHSLALQVGDE